MSRRLVVASISLLLCACATTPSAPPKPFVATGGVNSRIGSASFSADAVMGPKINVRNVDGDDWRGTLLERSIDVSAHPGHLNGVNLTMAIDQEPNHLTVTGQIDGRIFRFELTADKLMVRTPTRSDDLPRTGPNEYDQVNFTGDAVEGKRPEPQFALALAGTFL